jgi:hypothetical protein
MVLVMARASSAIASNGAIFSSIVRFFMVLFPFAVEAHGLEADFVKYDLQRPDLGAAAVAGVNG